MTTGRRQMGNKKYSTVKAKGRITVVRPNKNNLDVPLDKVKTMVKPVCSKVVRVSKAPLRVCPISITDQLSEAGIKKICVADVTNVKGIDVTKIIGNDVTNIIGNDITEIRKIDAISGDNIPVKVAKSAESVIFDASGDGTEIVNFLRRCDR